MERPTPLFVLSLSATLLMLGVGMIVAILPQRVHEMTGSLGSVGLVASIFAFAYLLAQLPIIALSDRLGPKWFLMIGYLMCAISGLAYLTADTASGIFVGRTLQGFGEAAVWALGPAVLSLAYPRAKGRVIGIYNAAIHAGLMAGPLLGLLIAPDGHGRLPFQVFSVLCFLAGLYILTFLRPASGLTDGARPTVRQFSGLLRRSQAVVLLGGVSLYGAGYGSFLTVLPVSLSTTHGFGPTPVSLHFVLFYAAISLSQLIAGTLSDHVGRQGILVWGMAFAAIGLAAFPHVPGLWTFAPLGVAGIGLGMYCVASIAELNECAPDNLKGAISGSYYFFWGAGYVLGPLAIGAVGASFTLLSFTVLAALFGMQSLAIRIVRD